MNVFKINPRVKRVLTKLGSLILMVQRMPMVQMIFPEANMVGGSAMSHGVSLAVTSVVGLGLYDTVAGATTIAQITPVSAATTVPAAVGSNLVFSFQCTGAPGIPGCWTTTALPAGLTHANATNSATDSITGIPTATGTKSVTVTAWRDATPSGDSFSKAFNIVVDVAVIATHPASTSISSGATTTLSVVGAQGTGTGLTYQWYQGASGVTTSPISGATSSSYTTPALTTTTNYWVQVKRTGVVETTKNYTITANSNTATVTVGSTTPSVSVAVAPASVAENSGTGMVYTFTRTGATTSALTTNFTVGGTATLTTDYTVSGAASYTASAGTVTFAAGASTATVTVTPVADTTVEADETAILTLATGTGYTVGTPSAATGTITNDDTSVSVAVSPASVAENSGTGMVYTFTRTGVTTGALTANFTVGGTATLTTDYTVSGAASYTASAGTVTFAAGATTATVTVTPVGDTTVESNETTILTLTTGTGYTVGTPSAATGTINNDDTAVSLAVSPASVLENSGTGMVYTFTRTGVTTGALTVNFTVGGTATLTTDYTVSGASSYTASAGTVAFAAGASTATVTVTPVADTTVESDETILLTLASGTGYTITTATAVTATITNDDTAFSSWASVLPANQSGALQTPQNDGVCNLLKYAFNMDPTKPDVRKLVVGAGNTVGLPGNSVVSGKVRMEYIRRRAASSPGITYTVQCGSDLQGWALPVTQVSATQIGTTDWERVVVDGPAGNTKSFMRVMVTAP